MANTVKLKDGSYIDSSGVYDTEQGANLATVVSGLKSDKSNLLETVKYSTTTSNEGTGQFAWSVDIARSGYTALIASIGYRRVPYVTGGIDYFDADICSGFFNEANLPIDVWVLYVKNS